MQGYNSIQLIGNLGHDPTLRYTASGQAVLNLRVAVTTGFDDSQRTDWLTVIAWDKLAEACNQYLTKGSRIFVEGRLQIRRWQSDNSQTRYATEVVARQVIFLDRPDGRPSNSASPPEEGEVPEAPDLPF